MKYDLIIIGGGPAGLTAGLYGARGGLKTLLLEKAMPGGQAALTDVIENFPGFPEGISGPELMFKFQAQAQKFGLEIKTAEVTGVDFSGAKKVFAGGEQYEAKAVIVATGARARVLNVPGEEEFRGRGVSYCATCDGAFFRDKKVAVVGGGDSAIEEALFLTKFVSEVVVIHRRDQLRATKILQQRAFNNEKISFRWNSVVEEILGEQAVSGIRLKNIQDGTIQEEKVDGVFVFIGTVPNTDFLRGTVKLNEKGYIITDDFLTTSVPGVFAAGDVREKFLRQVSTAVGDGAVAAMAAERYIAGMDFK
ncbi:thioredoxin-disulfide reductase [Calderihabitans maritimus]|uniref:Thioredoxin reductase n=1 Tax=Calderihabitans maritimus TaxID=1246530 RepID=A0A1Z5HW19_9FIRM|nr:thioredoxin-disulfide reductase [Calderihabitans maritimus]GAW93732.1 thioredoxin reductase [Calderihabitans maritimus]